ncbi:MAG: hypothetical protein WC110_08625 [Bacteroidales bacterium]
MMERLNPVDKGVGPNPYAAASGPGVGAKPTAFTQPAPTPPPAGSSKARIRAYAESQASWERARLWASMPSDMSYTERQDAIAPYANQLRPGLRESDIYQSLLRPGGSKERSLLQQYAQQQGNIVSSSGTLVPLQGGGYGNITTGEVFTPTTTSQVIAQPSGSTTIPEYTVTTPQLPGWLGGIAKLASVGGPLKPIADVGKGLWQAGEFMGVQHLLGKSSETIAKQERVYRDQGIIAGPPDAPVWTGTQQELNRYLGDVGKFQALQQEHDTRIDQMFGGKRPGAAQLVTYPFYETMHGAAEQYTAIVGKPAGEAISYWTSGSSNPRIQTLWERRKAMYPLSSAVIEQFGAGGLRGLVEFGPPAAIEFMGMAPVGGEVLARHPEAIVPMAALGLKMQAEGIGEGLMTRPGEFMGENLVPILMFHTVGRGAVRAARAVNPFFIESIPIARGQGTIRTPKLFGGYREIPNVNKYYAVGFKRPLSSPSRGGEIIFGRVVAFDKIPGGRFTTLPKGTELITDTVKTRTTVIPAAKTAMEQLQTSFKNVRGLYGEGVARFGMEGGKISIPDTVAGKAWTSRYNVALRSMESAKVDLGRFVTKTGDKYMYRSSALRTTTTRLRKVEPITGQYKRWFRGQPTEILESTRIKMPSGLQAQEGDIPWSRGTFALMGKYIDVKAPKLAADLWRGGQRVGVDIAQSPLWKPTVREPFGEAPTTSAARGTMETVMRNWSEYGDRIVNAGSRGSRVFVGKGFRDISKSDFDTYIKKGIQEDVFSETVSTVRSLEGRGAGKILSDKGRLSIWTRSGEEFIHASAKEHYPTFTSKPFKVPGVGGKDVYVISPRQQVRAKIGGMLEGWVQEPGKKLRLQHNPRRVKDIVDTYSQSRAMAADLLTPRELDFGGVLTRKQIGMARDAAGFSETVLDYVETVVKRNKPQYRSAKQMFGEIEVDLLKDVSWEPRPQMDVANLRRSYPLEELTPFEKVMIRLYLQEKPGPILSVAEPWLRLAEPTIKRRIAKRYEVKGIQWEPSISFIKRPRDLLKQVGKEGAFYHATRPGGIIKTLSQEGELTIKSREGGLYFGGREKVYLDFLNPSEVEIPFSQFEIFKNKVQGVLYSKGLIKPKDYSPIFEGEGKPILGGGVVRLVAKPSYPKSMSNAVRYWQRNKAGKYGRDVSRDIFGDPKVTPRGRLYPGPKPMTGFRYGGLEEEFVVPVGTKVYYQPTALEGLTRGTRWHHLGERWAEVPKTKIWYDEMYGGVVGGRVRVAEVSLKPTQPHLMKLEPVDGGYIAKGVWRDFFAGKRLKPKKIVSPRGERFDVLGFEVREGKASIPLYPDQPVSPRSAPSIYDFIIRPTKPLKKLPIGVSPVVNQFLSPGYPQPLSRQPYQTKAPLLPEDYTVYHTGGHAPSYLFGKVLQPRYTLPTPIKKPGYSTMYTIKDSYVPEITIPSKYTPSTPPIKTPYFPTTPPPKAPYKPTIPPGKVTYFPTTPPTKTPYIPDIPPTKPPYPTTPPTKPPYRPVVPPEKPPYLPKIPYPKSPAVTIPPIRQRYYLKEETPPKPPKLRLHFDVLASKWNIINPIPRPGGAGVYPGDVLKISNKQYSRKKLVYVKSLPFEQFAKIDVKVKKVI